MKIIANLPLLNSVLNPETSSLSPSAKSNGVRFNSAKTEIIHLKHGIKKTKNQKYFCIIDKQKILREKEINILKRIIKINETSYEIVCARNRILPKEQKLEFDDHPAIKLGYTPIPKIAKK
jgi:hypothetical protein